MSFLEPIDILSRASDSTSKKLTELTERLAELTETVNQVRASVSAQETAPSANAVETARQELQAVDQRLKALENNTGERLTSIQSEPLEGLLKEVSMKLDRLSESFQSQLANSEGQPDEKGVQRQAENKRDIFITAAISALLCSVLTFGSLAIYLQMRLPQLIERPTSSQR